MVFGLSRSMCKEYYNWNDMIRKVLNEKDVRKKVDMIENLIVCYSMDKVDVGHLEDCSDEECFEVGTTLLLNELLKIVRTKI